ncbi:MAG: hypothetical protein AAF740_14280 [Bacteroidota bacterium]
MSEAIPILGIIFSVPLAAIVGGFYIKAQKLKMQQGKGNGISDKEYKALRAALEENEELHRRLQNLEIIVEDLNEQVKQLPESNVR